MGRGQPKPRHCNGHHIVGNLVYWPGNKAHELAKIADKLNLGRRDIVRAVDEAYALRSAQEETPRVVVTSLDSHGQPYSLTAHVTEQARRLRLRQPGEPTERPRRYQITGIECSRISK